MERTARATAVMAAVLVVLLGGLLTLRRFDDLDVLWHVRTGEWILAQGRIPRTDPFGAVTAGRPWLDVAWGGQIALASIRRVAGLAGVQVAAVLVVMTTLATLLGRVPRTPLVLVGALSFVLATWTRMLVRPDLLVVPLIPLLLLLVDRLPHAPGRSLAGLAALTVVWSNLHGSFVLAPLVAGAAGLASWISPGPTRRRALWGAALVVAALAPVANPHGLRIYSLLRPYVESVLAALHLGPTSERLMITEWTPTWHLLRPGNLVFSWGAPLVLVALLALSFASLGRRLPLWRAFVAILFLGLASAAVRNLMPLGVAALTLIALGERDRLRSEEGKPGFLAVLVDGARARIAIAVVVALASAFQIGSAVTDRFYVRLDLPQRTGVDVDMERVPEGAVQWLATQDYPGKAFNNFDSGVYLLYRLYPHFRPYDDARVVDPDFVLEMQRTVRDPAAFDGLVREEGIGTVILVHPSFESLALLPRLRVDPHWRLAFRDHNVTIHVRADLPEPRPRLEPWPLDPALEPGARFINDRLQRWKRSVLPAAELTDAFVSALLGDREREREAYRRALERDPANARARAYFAAGR